MKTLRPVISLPRRWSVMLAGVLWLAGCVSGPDWPARVGSYTYDDAVKELGPPDKKETLTDGTLVAEWLQANGRSYATYRGGYPRPYSWGPPLEVAESPASYVRLTFGPDHQLTAAKRLYK